MDAVVSPVDHRRFVPKTVSVDDPQLSVTDTDGAAGTANGDAVPEPAALVHPPTVCVTVYVPAVVTVIDAVVSPVDHNKFVPVAVNVDDPQLSVTVTVGADGAAGSDKVSFNVFEEHPLSNVIAYEPDVNPVIVYGSVTTPLLPDEVPVHVTVPVPVPFTTIEPSLFPHTEGSVNAPAVIVGAANGAAVPEPGGLVHPPTVCVTVYVPAVVTVIDAVVSPVDHNKFVPVAVNVDDPQLSVTVTVGAAGIAPAVIDVVPQVPGVTHPPSPRTK
mgnify:CR=1 FL=1